MSGKKRLLLMASLLMLVLLMSGCAVGKALQNDATVSEEYYGAGDSYAPEPQAEAPMEGIFAEDEMRAPAMDTIASTDLAIERLIIRTGSISLRADNTVAVKETIEEMVSGLAQDGAFIVYSNQYGGDDESPYISMQIRVPATEFDSAMDQIAAMAAQGTTPERNENADDVTEEYVDVQSRLESLQAARDRLLSLMENAETTEDLLAAERQLTEREAEIESLQGRMNYLAESARLSSISVDLTPYILSQPVDTTWRPLETVRRAFDSLLNGLEGFADFLLFFIIAVLPILLIIGLIIYVIVRVIIAIARGAKRRKDAKLGATPQADEEA